MPNCTMDPSKNTYQQINPLEWVRQQLITRVGVTKGGQKADNLQQILSWKERVKSEE